MATITLESLLDQAAPEGTLCVHWTMEDGSPNSDLFSHQEFVNALLWGTFAGCRDVRFEGVPDEEGLGPITTPIIHTDEHPFCSDVHCPCHDIQGPQYYELICQPLLGGLMTAEEANRLFFGEQL